GRSVPGIDLGGAIIAARDAGLLIKGGGHAMAAGFTLEAERIEALRDFLVERMAAAAKLPDAPDLPIEGTAAVAGIDETLAAAIGRVGPFGAGNEEPVFVVPRARIVRSDRIGRNEKTIRAIVEGETGGRLKTILFRAGDSDLAAALSRPGGEPLNLAGHIRAEQWNGRTTVSLILIDASPA
ncbi:MAG TPA: DHHA1 domain-containing protein, partial [Acidiphilium sp.]|nr:DHHA1 domain-containing protein [Acidiphilium sp.]